MTTDAHSYYAALDLGSNSFHLIIVQLTDSGIQELDKIRHMVRLGEGLDKNNYLSNAAMTRALEALSSMRQRIAHIPEEHIRVVGTNTMRIAENGEEFLKAAEEAIGTNIEIISGAEEARLIYLGVIAHNYFPDRNLVIDIGGGSTEIITGTGKEIHLLRSVKMGCANMANRFFADEKITPASIKKAVDYVGKNIEPFQREVIDFASQRITFCSGTAKATEKVLQQLHLCERGIEKKALDQLIDVLVDIGRSDHLSDVLDLNPDRRFGFIGGVCIILGLFKHLQLTQAIVSQQALREGVILELMNRADNKDEREHTVSALQQRFQINLHQAKRVTTLARHLNQQLPPIDLPSFHSLLTAASNLHEIGLAIDLNKHQDHGEYILIHADLPGFTQLMQQMLAVLVKGQRKKIPSKLIHNFPLQYQPMLWQYLLVIRLSVLLYRSRVDIDPKDYPKIEINKQTVHLTFPEGFLAERPLTVADLNDEKNQWKHNTPYRLTFNSPAEHGLNMN